MFYGIKNNKIIGFGQTEKDLDGSGIDLIIQKDFTQEENQKINSGYSYTIETEEFEESAESIEYEKQADISKFKELEKQATGKRGEYLTAELLPEGKFKTLKLDKLEKEGKELEFEYETMTQELIGKYGETILLELI